MVLIAILATDILCWRFLPISRSTIRLGMRLTFFLAYSATLFLVGFSPLQPVGNVGSNSWQLVASVLVILWWFLCARMLTEVLSAILVFRTEGGGRLLRDVAGALIFLAATVASAAYVLQLPVKGLLATSGALAIIVGLALQSTLSDVFSGIVLNATLPYQVGDWIHVDGFEGRVTDIDWRATLLLTALGSTVVIPNSVAAKTKIQNLSRPDNQHGVAISLHLPLRFRPERIQEVLEQALRGYSALLPSPAPKVILKTITEGLLEYEASGFVRTPEEKIPARNRLYDLAYRHLRASGIDIEQMAEIPPDELTKAVVDDVRAFSAFTLDSKSHLLKHLTRHAVEAGEFVLKANEVSDHLLVIGCGVVSVQLQNGEQWIEVARMGPAEILGEQGIMDHLPNGAQFMALTTVQVFKVHREAVQACIQAGSPLRASLVRLQAVRRQHASSMLLRKAPAMPPGGFLKWLRQH